MCIILCGKTNLIFREKSYKKVNKNAIQMQEKGKQRLKNTNKLIKNTKH
jgi:uncharacterized C2H2 Zn-finger protein